MSAVPMSARMHMAMRTRKVQVEWQMPMCAENKRQYAEQKARCKTDEIEIRPCHNVRLRSPDALLRDVRASSGFKASNRPELTKRFEALKKPPGFTGNAPGGPSRWSTERTGEWEPVDPKVVVEVAYDHFTGGRFRHGTKVLRWRPDKDPRQCTMDQVEHREGKTMALL